MAHQLLDLGEAAGSIWICFFNGARWFRGSGRFLIRRTSQDETEHQLVASVLIWHHPLWVWTLSSSSLIRWLITRLRDRSSQPRKSAVPVARVDSQIMLWTRCWWTKAPPFHFGRSSRDFGSGVVWNTGDSRKQRCAVFTHKQERVRDQPSFCLSGCRQQRRWQTCPGLIPPREMTASIRGSQVKNIRGKEGHFFFFFFFFTPSCEHLVLFRANSERKCLWFEWIFYEKTKHLQPMSFVFPLVGLAAFVAAACSRQLRCRINLIIATIYLFIFLVRTSSSKDYLVEASQLLRERAESFY